MGAYQKIASSIATTVVVAIVVLGTQGCGKKVSTVASLENLDSIPTMVVENMQAVQTSKGVVTGRLIAPVMKRFTRGSEPYESFPNTFRVIGYTSTGEIETEIKALRAVHKTGKAESWEAYGDVVIINHLKQEVMETDTLYWDRKGQRIYTHCFVKITSPDFFMQGYGMESDERASSASIQRPFDSYGDFDKSDMNRQNREVQDSLKLSQQVKFSQADSLPTPKEQTQTTQETQAKPTRNPQAQSSPAPLKLLN